MMLLFQLLLSPGFSLPGEPGGSTIFLEWLCLYVFVQKKVEARLGHIVDALNLIINRRLFEL